MSLTTILSKNEKVYNGLQCATISALIGVPTGMYLTNPRVTGYSSFAKAILACKTFNLDSKAPKTCKKLYQYLKEKGYYNGERD